MLDINFSHPSDTYTNQLKLTLAVIGDVDHEKHGIAFFMKDGLINLIPKSTTVITVNETSIVSAFVYDRFQIGIPLSEIKSLPITIQKEIDINSAVSITISEVDDETYQTYVYNVPLNQDKKYHYSLSEMVYVRPDFIDGEFSIFDWSVPVGNIGVTEENQPEIYRGDYNKTINTTYKVSDLILDDQFEEFTSMIKSNIRVSTVKPNIGQCKVSEFNFYSSYADNFIQSSIFNYNNLGCQDRFTLLTNYIQYNVTTVHGAEINFKMSTHYPYDLTYSYNQNLSRKTPSEIIYLGLFGDVNINKASDTPDILPANNTISATLGDVPVRRPYNIDDPIISDEIIDNKIRVQFNGLVSLVIYKLHENSTNYDTATEWNVISVDRLGIKNIDSLNEIYIDCTTDIASLELFVDCGLIDQELHKDIIENNLIPPLTTRYNNNPSYYISRYLSKYLRIGSSQLIKTAFDNVPINNEPIINAIYDDYENKVELKSTDTTTLDATIITNFNKFSLDLDGAFNDISVDVTSDLNASNRDNYKFSYHYENNASKLLTEVDSRIVDYENNKIQLFSCILRPYNFSMWLPSGYKLLSYVWDDVDNIDCNFKISFGLATDIFSSKYTINNLDEKFSIFKMNNVLFNKIDVKFKVYMATKKVSDTGNTYYEQDLITDTQFLDSLQFISLSGYVNSDTTGNSEYLIEESNSQTDCFYNGTTLTLPSDIIFGEGNRHLSSMDFNIVIPAGTCTMLYNNTGKYFDTLFFVPEMWAYDDGSIPETFFDSTTIGYNEQPNIRIQDIINQNIFTDATANQVIHSDNTNSAVFDIDFGELNTNNFIPVRLLLYDYNISEFDKAYPLCFDINVNGKLHKNRFISNVLGLNINDVDLSFSYDTTSIDDYGVFTKVLLPTRLIITANDTVKNNNLDKLWATYAIGDINPVGIGSTIYRYDPLMMSSNIYDRENHRIFTNHINLPFYDTVCLKPTDNNIISMVIPYASPKIIKNNSDGYYETSKLNKNIPLDRTLWNSMRVKQLDIFEPSPPYVIPVAQAMDNGKYKVGIYFYFLSKDAVPFRDSRLMPEGKYLETAEVNKLYYLTSDGGSYGAYDFSVYYDSNSTDAFKCVYIPLYTESTNPYYSSEQSLIIEAVPYGSYLQNAGGNNNRKYRYIYYDLCGKDQCYIVE